MKFLIDANLPIRLARWLESQCHDARHVAELPDGYETIDRPVWETADTHRLADIIAALSSGRYVELHRTALVVNTDPRQE